MSDLICRSFQQISHAVLGKLNKMAFQPEHEVVIVSASEAISDANQTARSAVREKND